MKIQAHSLSFRHRASEKYALSECTFSVESGTVCCLLGVNGSGKSTLLTLLAGLFGPSSGELSLAGHSLPREFAEIQESVAFVPQNPDVYILGSLVQEDLFLALRTGDATARHYALTLAATFGLEDLLTLPVQTLSFGQKRKLCLASALAASPSLLLLDEPFAGLDFPASLAMRDIIRRNRAAGITQIIAGHDLDLMADLADTYLLLQQGQVLAHGTQEAVFPHLVAAGVRPPCCWHTGSIPAWLIPDCETCIPERCNEK